MGGGGGSIVTGISGGSGELSTCGGTGLPPKKVENISYWKWIYFNTKMRRETFWGRNNRYNLLINISFFSTASVV